MDPADHLVLKTSTWEVRRRFDDLPESISMVGSPPPAKKVDDRLAGALRKYLSFDDEPWRAQGKCVELGTPVDVFFPGKGDSQKEAKAICARCPVRVQCDDYANRTNSTYGIWGGKIRHRHKKELSEDDGA